MEEPKGSNWVERRARREYLLQNQSQELWSEVRSALQDACESWNRYYSTNPPDTDVSCKPENGQRLRINRLVPLNRAANFRDEQLEAVVSFEKNAPAISIAYSTGNKTFKMDADQESVFMVGDKDTTRWTSDQVSERILDPVLFPKPARHMRSIG